MNRSARVSVVMTAWNRAAFIRDAVQSVLDQTVHDLELIVVDDGSSDGTRAIVESMARANPRVRLIERPHEGRRRALNAGLDEARGDRIAFLDADDLWHPSFLERLHQTLDGSGPPVAMAYCTYRLFRDGNPPWDRSRWLPHQPPVHSGRIMQPLVRFNFISQIAVLIDRAALDAVGGFEGDDSGYASDWDLWLRIAERFEIAGVPEILVVARVHADNMSHDVVAHCRADVRVLERAAGRCEPPETARELGLPRSIAHHRLMLAFRLLEAGRRDEARAEAWRALRNAGFVGRGFGLVVLAAARDWPGSAPLRALLRSSLAIKNKFSWGAPAPASGPPGSRESVSVAVIACNAERDLVSCLDHIRRQTSAPAEIVVIDNASTDGTLAIAQATPGIRVVALDRNTGFAGGANAAWTATKGDWLAIVNQDACLAPGFLDGALASAARAARIGLRVGAVQGQILMTGSTPGEGRIDALGIALRRSRRNLILGRGLPQQAAVEGEVFGPDGAAAVYRRAALDDAAVEGEPFDSDFFAYREDADLAWRLQRRGWKTVVAANAVAYHRRTLTSETRSTIAPALRRASARNHYLLLLKNERAIDLLRDLAWMVPFEIAFLVRLAVRDPRSLAGIGDALRLAPRALRRRRAFFAKPPIDPGAPRRFMGRIAPVPFLTEAAPDRWGSPTVLAAIVAVGLVLRLMHAGADPPLTLSPSNAEIMDGPWYMAEAVDGVRGLTTDVPVQYRRPLFTAIMRLGFVGGVSLERAQVVEAVAGALLVLVAAAAARRAFGSRAAVVTALLLAVGFVPVGYGRATVVYGPLAALLGAVFWLLTWSVPRSSATAGDLSKLVRHAAPWAAVLLLGAAAAGLQAIAILMAPALAIGLAIRSRRHALVVMLAAVAASAMLLALGIIPFSLVDATIAKAGAYFGSMAPLDVAKRWLRAPFISGLWPDAPLLCALGWLGVLAFAGRANDKDRPRRGLERALAVWFVVWISALSLFEYTEGGPPLRYFMPALVPAALLAGSVIDRLLDADGLSIPSAPWLVFPWSALGFYWALGTLLIVVWPYLFPAGAPAWIENAVSFKGLISGALVFGIGLAIAFRQKPPGSIRLSTAGAAALLLLGLAPDAARLYPVLARPTYSLRDANRSVAELIGPGASVYGPYAHALTYDTPHVSRHMEEYDYRTIRRAMIAKSKGWTHLIVSVDDGVKVGQVFWAAGTPLSRVAILTVRDYPIAIYRFEWAQALGYRLTALENSLPHHKPPP